MIVFSGSDRSDDEGSNDEDCDHGHAPTRSLNRARALTRARGRKRYHALFQRIARCGIADALGERQWKAFKRFVRRHFLRAFLDLFDPADHVLRCCGPLDGGCCPHRFVVDLAGPERVDFRLAGLHLDHEYDVRHICEAWRRAMPANPRRWDDGVNGLRLAHLLFGVQPLGAWPARVRLRCGNNRYYGTGDQDHDTSATPPTSRTTAACSRPRTSLERPRCERGAASELELHPAYEGDGRAGVGSA